MTLGVRDLPPLPVYLAALGPRMLRLAGQVADGVLLSWTSAGRSHANRQIIDEAAERAGRDPARVKLVTYVRVCVDEDIDAARLALSTELLGYALPRPGSSLGPYRAMFGQLGFGEALTELEERRASGASPGDLARAVPDELLRAVAYFGPPQGAAAAFSRLSRGVDEAIVRIVPTRPGLESALQTMAALAPGGSAASSLQL